MSTNNIALTDKFIAWATKEATSTTSTPEEANRKLVELVWEAAQREPKKTVQRSLQDYSVAESDLRNRIDHVVTVARNTLRKLQRQAPEEWAWVNAGKYTIEGVFVDQHSFGQTRPASIVADLAKGGTLPKSAYVLIRSGDKTTKVPVTLLGYDPVAVAQQVRAAVKRDKANELVNKEKALQAQRTELKNKLEKAEKELQAHEEAKAEKQARAARKAENRAKQLQRVTA